MIMAWCGFPNLGYYWILIRPSLLLLKEETQKRKRYRGKGVGWYAKTCLRVKMALWYSSEHQLSIISKITQKSHPASLDLIEIATQERNRSTQNTLSPPPLFICLEMPLISKVLPMGLCNWTENNLATPHSSSTPLKRKCLLAASSQC